MLQPLTRLPIFQDLEAQQLDLLEPLLEAYNCPPKTIVFEQGDPAEHLYLILNGEISILYKPYDAPRITLTHLRYGDAFGWSAVIGSPKYTSGVVTDTALEALRIRGTELLRLCIEHPVTGEIILDRLARVVSSRWKNAHAEIHSILDKAMANANVVKKESRKEMQSVTSADSSSREQQVRVLLERLSAYVEQFHGGSVEFVAFDGTTLKVRLGGACLGCPLQPATLHGWVAGTVRQFFPDIEVVEEK